MVNKICAKCGKPFSYEPNPNYPDKRKYCDKCGAEKKAEYEAKQKAENPPVQSTAQAQQTKIGVVPHSEVINYKDKPHSYEFGKPASRHKIYYNTTKELYEQIEALSVAGLLEVTEKEIVQHGMKEEVWN